MQTEKTLEKKRTTKNKNSTNTNVLDQTKLNVRLKTKTGLSTITRRML